jgi:hypothetical protein
MNYLTYFFLKASLCHCKGTMPFFNPYFKFKKNGFKKNESGIILTIQHMHLPWGF